MNPWWLVLIIPGSAIGGALGLVVFFYLIRNSFPFVFTPDDF